MFITLTVTKSPHVFVVVVVFGSISLYIVWTVIVSTTTRVRHIVGTWIKCRNKKKMLR